MKARSKFRITMVYANLLRIYLHSGMISELISYIPPLLEHSLAFICLYHSYVVQRASYPAKVLCAHMGIYFCRFRTPVSKKFLNIPDIGTSLKEMCCKAVPEGMNGNILLDTRVFTCIGEYDLSSSGRDVFVHILPREYPF